MKPGGPALWGEAFRGAINAHINTGYTKLIGVFHTEYGLLNTGTTQFPIQSLAREGAEGEGPRSGLAGLVEMLVWITKVL